MNDAGSLNPRVPTFSQAQGYEALPGLLKLGEISDEARRDIWDLLYWSVQAEEVAIQQAIVSSEPHQIVWGPILYVLHREVLKEAVDYFESADDIANLLRYKDLVLEDLSFNELFDMLQLIIRQPSCPEDFVLSLSGIFRDKGLAYTIDVESPPTILPSVTPEEGGAVGVALQELREGSFLAAVEHLKNASERIDAGDWGGSVRESIHAVESVARLLDPEGATTLGPALSSLEKTGRLHPALKKAFGNLYGYTSDEQGIRHPLLDHTDSPVGRDEAVFMYGACASFASYLWRRRQGSDE